MLVQSFITQHACTLRRNAMSIVLGELDSCARSTIPFLASVRFAEDLTRRVPCRSSIFPCVLEEARSHASLVQAWRDDAGGVIPQRLRSLLRTFGESYRDEPIPTVWLKELEQLNRLPPVAPSAWLATANEAELSERNASHSVLAPLVTDGLEPLQNCLVRLCSMVEGPASTLSEVFRRAGIRVSVVRPMPAIVRDARWVVRVRVNNELPAEDSGE